LVLNYNHIYSGVVLHRFHCNMAQQNVHEGMRQQFPQKMLPFLTHNSLRPMQRESHL